MNFKLLHQTVRRHALTTQSMFWGSTSETSTEPGSKLADAIAEIVGTRPLDLRWGLADLYIHLPHGVMIAVRHNEELS